MTQELLDENIRYFRSTGIDLFEKPDLYENINHYIANSLADIGHELSNEDIIFTFSRNLDIKMVVKEEYKETIKQEERSPRMEEYERDPAGQIDSVRIGILTTGNVFYEYCIHLDGESRGHIFLVDIKRVNLKKIKPDYTLYNQKSDVRTRQYRTLDHLFFDFEEMNETIALYGHIVKSNKSLQEINKSLLKRL